MARNDVRDAIAQHFLEALNAGTIPWRKPWNAGTGRPRNAVTQRPYRGVNALYLGLVQTMRGYPTGEWLTENQTLKAGGRIIYSEFRNSTAAVLWKFLKKEKVVNGKKITETFPMCRSFNLYNRAQCEGLPPSKVAAPAEHTPIEAAQRILDGMPNRPKVNVVESEGAYYVPALDSVTLPLLSQFVNAESFYATAFHELAHSTGHKSRLGRDLSQQREKYSKEELVAEMAASFLCAEAEILDAVQDNATAYVQHWAEVLGKEPRMIVEAAGLAQKAADYILGTTFPKDGEGE